MTIFPLINNEMLKVLIVKDEALLVMDIGSMVQDAGHHVVREAGSLREVMALPSSLKPDLAFVDIQLDEGSTCRRAFAPVGRAWRWCS